MYIISFTSLFPQEQEKQVLFLGSGPGHISSSWVKIRLHTKNHLRRLPGSALKVCVVVVGGGV